MFPLCLFLQCLKKWFLLLLLKYVFPHAGHCELLSCHFPLHPKHFFFNCNSNVLDSAHILFTSSVSFSFIRATLAVANSIALAILTASSSDLSSDNSFSWILSSFNPHINLSRNALFKNNPNSHVKAKCLRRTKKLEIDSLSTCLAL